MPSCLIRRIVTQKIRNDNQDFDPIGIPHWVTAITLEKTNPLPLEMVPDLLDLILITVGVLST